MKQHHELSLFNNRYLQDKMVDRNDEIALYTNEEICKILNGQTLSSIFNPYYSEERIERHIFAQTASAAFYQLGAKLINCDSIDDKQKNQFLTAYKQIPQVTARYDRLIATNPLHAIFVIKVALDYLAPTMIFKLYELIYKNSQNMTINYMNKIRFPNGSEFLNEHVGEHVLRAYLLNNKEQFDFAKNHLLKLEEEEKSDWNNYNVFIFGDAADPTTLDRLNSMMIRSTQEYPPIDALLRLEGQENKTNPAIGL